MIFFKMRGWACVAVVPLLACSEQFDVGTAEPAVVPDAAPGGGTVPSIDGGADADGATPDTTLPCGGPWGLCWEHPSLTAEDFVGVAAGANDEAWAITKSGVVFRYDGQAWSQHSSYPRSASVVSFASHGPSDMRAVIGGGVWGFDGSSWRWSKPYAISDANDQGATRVMAPLDDGLWMAASSICVYDDLRSTNCKVSEEAGVVIAIAGQDLGSAHVMYGAGAIGRFDKTADRWVTEVPAVGASGIGLATGPNGTMTAFAELRGDRNPAAPVRFRISRLEGGAWTHVEADADVAGGHGNHSAMRGAGPNIARGRDGTYVVSRWRQPRIFRWSGDNLRLVTDTVALSVAATPQSVLAVGQGGGIVELEGPSGSRVLSERTTTRRVVQLVALRADVAVAVLLPTQYADEIGAGRPDVVRIESGKVVSLAPPIRTAFISALSTNDIWAVGGAAESANAVAHWNGTTWSVTNVPEMNQVLGLWERAPDDVWAVGLHGSISRFDGSRWNKIQGAVPDGCLDSVAGNGPSDVWIAGAAHFEAGSCFGSRVYHYDGRTLEDRTEALATALATTADSTRAKVVAAGSGHAWFLLSNTVAQWDGKQFVAHPVMPGVEDAWAFNRDEVWFAGREGIFRWDGREFRQRTNQVPSGGLHAISGTRSGDYWVGGDNEGILRSRKPMVTPR